MIFQFLHQIHSLEKMRWEKIEVKAIGKEGEGVVELVSGPGKRWGHTCNSINGGRHIYVFGGYGKDNCQTNQVHVFDTGVCFLSLHSSMQDSCHFYCCFSYEFLFKFMFF